MSGIGVDNDFDISAADGVTTVFTYTFFAYDTSQVKVYSVLDNVETEITSGITITPNSSFIGGTITFAVAPLAAVGDILRRRAVPYTQTTEFTDLIRYKETAIEKALNTLVMQIQQVYSRVSRAMRYSEAAGVTEPIIGTPEDGKALIFDGVAGRLKAGPNAADIANAQTNAAAAAASATAASTAKTGAETARDAAIAAAAGIKWRPSVLASTTAALPSVTYNNGASGVGATLTATANGALAAQDGVTLIAGDRLLVKDQVAQLQNGVYTVTQVGTGGTPFILTRATDADTWLELVSQAVIIEEGTTLADLAYICTVNQGGTIGVTGVTWAPFNPPLVIASQSEAEAGSENTKVMSALRVLQSIAFNFLTYLNNNNSGYVVGRAHAANTAVGTTTTTIPQDDTIPQNTEGAEFLTVNYTPKFASSTLRVTAVIQASTSGNDLWAAAIFRDSTANALKACGQRNDTINVHNTMTFVVETPASSTSATTFRLRAGPAAGTLTVNGINGSRYFGGVAPMTLTVEELKA